jgi:hypothetical protein
MQLLHWCCSRIDNEKQVIIEDDLDEMSPDVSGSDRFQDLVGELLDLVRL